MPEHRQMTQQKDDLTKSKLKENPENNKETSSEQPGQSVLLRVATNPGAPSPGDILAIQGMIGNRGVSRMIQAKLSVGPANDHYEQEADNVADKIMRMPDPQEEEEPIQGKSVQPGRLADGFEAGSEIEGVLAARKGGGSPLSPEVRNFMEPRFSADFDNIRVHTDSEAGRINRKLGAEAFTHGTDIYMGDSRYNPGTESGKRLLAHELTHVVQQTGSQTKAFGNQVRTKANPGRIIQRQMGAIDKFLSSESKEAKKQGLYNFFKTLDLPRQRLVCHILVKKVALSSITSEKLEKLWTDSQSSIGVDDFKAAVEEGRMAALKNAWAERSLLSIFSRRRNVNWTLFSDVIQFALSAPSLEAIQQQKAAQEAAKTAQAAPKGAPGMPSTNDFSETHATSYGSMGSTALGGANTGATQIAKLAGAGESSLSGAASGSSIVGAVGSTLAAVSDFTDLDMHAHAMSGTSIADKGLNATANLMDTGRSISSAVNQIDVARGAVQSGAATAATGAAAGLAIAGGTVLMAQGITGAISSDQQMTRLQGVKDKLINQYKEDDERRKQVATVAEYTVDNKRADMYSGIGKSVQGAAMVVGGALMFTPAAPAAVVVLAVAAAIGGLIAFAKFLYKRKQKKDFVDKLLNTETEYNKRKLTAEAQQPGAGEKVSKEEVRNELLQSQGFNTIDQLYNKTVQSMAEEAYKKAVVPAEPDPHFKEFIEGLGLVIDKDQKRPTIEEIARKIDA
jgi:hypothetical protein